MAELLLDASADANIRVAYKNKTPLWYAASNGCDGVVRLLLDRNAHADVADKDGITPLIRSSINGHLEVTRMLIASGARVNHAPSDGKFKGKTSLLQASANGHHDAAQLLLESGANLDAMAAGGNALHRACEHGQVRVATLLLDHAGDDGGSFNQGVNLRNLRSVKHSQRSARQLTSGEGDASSPRRRLDVDADDDAGRRPLHWASQYGHKACVSLLLSRRASVNVTDHEGSTALLKAVRFGHEPILRVLLDARADTGLADDKERTPLMVACVEGHYDVVQALVNAGVDVNASRMSDGNTAILVAAEGGHAQILRLLLQAGGDEEAVRHSDGATAHSIAQARKLERCIEVLQRSARRRARSFVDAVRTSAAQRHLQVEDWGPEAVVAALKLQSFYRGMRSRAQLIAEKGKRAEQLIVRVNSRKRSQKLNLP